MMAVRYGKQVAVALSMVLMLVGLQAIPSEAQAQEPAVYAAADASALEVQAENFDTTWYKGKSSPFTIDNVKQLRGFSHLVNTGAHDFTGEVVQLNDNVISAFAFTKSNTLEPIGTPEHPFQGTFDGKKKVIANLTLETGSRLSYVGMFGYAGDNAVIQNVNLQGGTIGVANKKSGKTVGHIGAIAGHLGGSLKNCTSSVTVSVVNDGDAPAIEGKTAEELCTITHVGGLVGSLGGDMVDCVHRAALEVSSTSNVTPGVPYIAGYVGGLAGSQGDEADAQRITNTARCANEGAVTLTISGAGGLDRFGVQTYSKSTMVGGIVGYTMGNVADCSNAAPIQTSMVDNGAVQAGWGASTCGGIVGSLRGPTIAEAASSTGVVGSNDTDPGYSEWLKTQGGIAKEGELRSSIGISIERCANTAGVTGLASVGGIAGSTGAFTQIVACSNTAQIEGTRWNKPCPSGIVGISNGDIAYCYNQGRVVSTTGGGYYASGIVGLLTTYNTSSTPDAMRLSVPELYGCYVTGAVGGNNQKTGMRSAVLAGENDGFIHDNCFLPDLSVDKAKDKDGFNDGKNHSRLVSDGEDRGTLARNFELSVNDMKSSLSVSKLNTPAAAKSDWSVYFAGVPTDFPQLSWQYQAATRQQLGRIASGIKSTTNPAYSASYAPVPGVVLSSGGTTLYQNADFRVVVSSDATTVGQSYSATIEGINAYEGQLASKASYTIAKADISTCTVSAPPAQFNWQRQVPSSITVRDDAGNVVDASEYTFRALSNDDGSTKAVGGKYYDYVNSHGAGYRYDIEVNAKPGSAHFTGTTTQAAFQITWASMMYSPENDNNSSKAPSAKLGNVVLRDDKGAIVEEWDIAKALKTKGFVKVKYTGLAIKPTFKTVTYLDRDMRDGTGKPYYYNPLDYDYLYVYGNPNPEDGQDLSSSCVNVTGSNETKLACVTARFSPGGNFNNYTNVFFEITPASIRDDVTITGMPASVPCAVAGAKVSPKLSYNGMTLKAGRDYTLSYKNNKKVGTARVTITGKGNYTGSISKTFKVTKGSVPLTVKGKTVTVKAGKSKTAFAVKNAQGKVTCKNTSEDKVAKKFSVTATGKVTVPAGTKPGTYSVKVKMTEKASANYKGGTVTSTAKVKVK